jgi:hypothetical protein
MMQVTPHSAPALAASAGEVEVEMEAPLSAPAGQQPLSPSSRLRPHGYTAEQLGLTREQVECISDGELEDLVLLAQLGPPPSIVSTPSPSAGQEELEVCAQEVSPHHIPTESSITVHF